MTTAVPESELARNFEFLKSPFWGKLAFSVLESRKAIEFFSNQFLFSKPCDSDWLDNAEKGIGENVRPPVMAFNAGFCQHRSFEEELRSLEQRTLILEGNDDKRPREGYIKSMKDCKSIRIPGLNVLPWENAGEFASTLQGLPH